MPAVVHAFDQLGWSHDFSSIKAIWLSVYYNSVSVNAYKASFQQIYDMMHLEKKHFLCICCVRIFSREDCIFAATNIAWLIGIHDRRIPFTLEGTLLP